MNSLIPDSELVDLRLIEQTYVPSKIELVHMKLHRGAQSHKQSKLISERTNN